MKVLIIGGVAAGTKVAAKLKRDNYHAQVTILTKSKDISYAGCGLPYYVGNVIENRESLIVNTPEGYKEVDAASRPSIAGAAFIDLSKVHKELPQFDKDEKLLLVCTKFEDRRFKNGNLKGYTRTRKASKSIRVFKEQGD